MTPARRVYVLVGVAVAGAAAVAIPARATYGARTTADEPQYLLSALSLAEDRDLWIEDELADQRYRDFHEVNLPVQTEPLDNGHSVSPHDPLLPALLAVPTGLGGWAAAKATLAGLAGVLAGLLTWVAHRRLRLGLGVSAGVVLAFGLTAPLSAYATQVYPELPAALAVTVAVAALTGRPGRGPLLALGSAVVALPWLGVKYVPVAVALVGVAAFWLLRPIVASRAPADRPTDRLTNRRPPIRLVLGLTGGLAVSGLAYLLVHRAAYGGWTVYAAGDHFVDGELTVVGNDPNYMGRSRRLLGLLLDRGFGLAAWMPGYLLIVPALALLLRRRPPGWLALTVPLAAGWATATWVALTMHGWWWPGRQTVVVMPLAVLVVAWWVDREPRLRPVLAAMTAFAVLAWSWLLAEVLAGSRTLVVDFEETTNPLYRFWRALLPDYRDPGPDDWLRQAAWIAVLGAVALLVATRWSPASAAADASTTSPASTTDEAGDGRTSGGETIDSKTRHTRRATYASG